MYCSMYFGPEALHAIKLLLYLYTIYTPVRACVAIYIIIYSSNFILNIDIS